VEVQAQHADWELHLSMWCGTGKDSYTPTTEASTKQLLMTENTWVDPSRPVHMTWFQHAFHPITVDHKGG
jgi:hypothetical protein